MPMLTWIFMGTAPLLPTLMVDEVYRLCITDP